MGKRHMNVSKVANTFLSGNRLGAWSLGIGIGTPIALVTFAASPLGTDFAYVMLGIPILLLFWVTSAIGAVVAAVKHLKNRKWWQGIVTAIPIVLVCAAAFNPFAFIRSCNFAGNIVNFIIMRPYYMARVQALPTTDGPRLVVFNRGGMIWASEGYVYDESDEVMLPPNKQSAAWKNKASHSELSCDGYSAYPLWGHFYIAYFPC